MTEVVEVLPTLTAKTTHFASKGFPIEHKVPGTTLDVISFSLLVVGAAAPVLFLLTIHIILRARRRRTKERYQATVFSFESQPCTDAWTDTQKDGEVSVWLTSNHIQCLDHSPHSTRGYRHSLQSSFSKKHWGTKYDLDETINAFFDSNLATCSTESEVIRSYKIESEDISQKTTGNNLLKKKHKSFESLCDVIINNMASVGQEPIELGDLPKTPETADCPNFSRARVEEQSVATESSMGEFSAEEEILRDFDAILSSYCDEESESAEEWHYMTIKY